MDEVFLRIKNAVMEEINPEVEISEAELEILFDKVFLSFTDISVSASRKNTYRKQLLNDIKRLDIIQELIDDKDITEIMVNGCNAIFYEKGGKLYKWDKQFISQKKLVDVVQRIAGISNKLVNEAIPIADTRLRDGSRVNIVMNPVAIDGPIITIRKFYEKPLSMERLIELNSITKEAAEFLKVLVISGYNIFISGGTGCGKTTFLNVLSNYIPSMERVITIEDSAELKLNTIENIVRLEARKANVEGRNEITIRDLIKSALRMRPDRIVVGEVRGAEAADMLSAMNTGHDGSISTGHGNGPEDMLLRLETMVLMGIDMPIEAIRRQIASAIDIVVHLGRLRDKSRRVLSISEVLGMENGEIQLNHLYKFVEEGVDENDCIKGRLEPCRNTFKRTKKLETAGYDASVYSGSNIDFNACGILVL